MSRSFVDLLFILLCSTIVLLSQSIQLGSVETKPAEVGSGAIASINADDVRLVVVDENELVFEGQRFANVQLLAESLLSGDTIILTVSAEAISHHRVMRVWSDVRDHGFTVKLGAKPIDGANKEI